MEPKHVDVQTLQLLEERMRSGKLPAKSTAQSFEQKSSIVTDPDDQDKMVLEFLKQQNKTQEHPTRESDDKPLDSSNKENIPNQLNLESSEKIDDIKPKEVLTEIKIDPNNIFHHSSDLSYQSVEQRGSKSLRKRKYDKTESASEKRPEDMVEANTKKPKMALNQAASGENNTLGSLKLDSHDGSREEDPNLLNKENIAISTGMKKITEFFKKTNPVSTSERAFTKTTTVHRVKSKGLTEKKQETLEIIVEDKRELTHRIKELEDRLEDTKKSREKEQIKANSELLGFQIKFDEYKNNVQRIMAKFVLDIETHKRTDRKAFLNRQKQRLGEYVSQREGSKFVDVWSDGFEMRLVKDKLETIIREREELEKTKKTVKSTKKSAHSTPKLSTQTDLGSTGSGNMLGGFVENTDSNLSHDARETKERLNAKVTMLQREENSLKDQLERLESEKIVFYQQCKKQYEEDHSRYGRPNPETNNPAWPILSERYQLLSLLGKGGFSEVYKAYDLDELNSVACKIHQLNPNWTENAKVNYIKHATREFEVHKELNHPNIVRLFDCINIDDHSFATVLEYCEGPDLSAYLKQHKILPEKDAKVIIKQILAGLKYLNDQKTKIIHYDLKPQNVMFNKGEIKISDFGLCKIVEPEVSRIELTSQGVGTYWYLPPECFMMDDKPPLINNKVDVWSIGVMLYEMLFGMRPFGHNMSQEKILKEKIILKSYNVSFPTKPTVTNETKEFIKKCLAYSQNDRIDICEAYELMYKK